MEETLMPKKLLLYFKKNNIVSRIPFVQFHKSQVIQWYHRKNKYISLSVLAQVKTASG